MADMKISQLPAVTTPLAETEVLPIVQSSTTKKVTVAELTTLIKHTMTMDSTNALQFGDAGYTASIAYNGDGSLRITPRAGYPVQIQLGNLKFSHAGYGIVDSTSAVSLNFSSTNVTLNAPLAQSGTSNTITADFSSHLSTMNTNDTLTISSLTMGMIEISEAAFWSNIALIAVSGASTAIVYRSDTNITITSGNANTVNVYRSGANVIIENKSPATLQIRTNIRKLG